MIPADQFLKLCSTDFLSDLVGEKVVKVSVSTGSTTKAGDNMAGSLLAIHFKTANSKIYHVLIKVPPYDNILQFSYARRRRIFELESRFYNDFVPKLSDFLRSYITSYCGTSEASPDHLVKLPVPECYGGGRDYLVLKDLRTEGFKLADRTSSGLDWKHVKLVLETLGRYHAMTFLYVKQEGEQYFTNQDNKCFLNGPVLIRHLPEYDEINHEKFSRFYLQACKLLAVEDPAISEKISKFSPKASHLMRGYLYKVDTAPEFFPVLSHGDLWHNNIIFRTDDQGQPEEVAFIDFQLTRRDTIFFDISYFLYTSTSPEFRADHLQGALDAYYDSFIGYLRSVDAEKECPEGFTKEWFKGQFFADLKFIFAYMTFAIPLQMGNWSLILGDPSKVETPKVFASDDKLVSEEEYLFGLNRLTYRLLKESPEALKRLKDIAHEMDALGVFDSPCP